MHTVKSRPRQSETLIEQYVRTKDTNCFETVVQQHAVMVHRVCMRILKDEHLAEDAAQDVFVLLARKAESIREPALLANWLYGVAVRKSLELRRTRGQHNTPLFDSDIAAIPACDNERAEVVSAIDEELFAIPEKYRTVLIMHYFSGDTLRTISRTTGVPFGTLSSRLQRGRSLLRSRLSKRGLTLGALLLTLGTRATEGSAATIFSTNVVAELTRQGVVGPGSSVSSAISQTATTAGNCTTNSTTANSCSAMAEVTTVDKSSLVKPATAHNHSLKALKSCAVLVLVGVTLVAIYSTVASSIQLSGTSSSSDPILSEQVRVSHLELPQGNNGGADQAPFVEFKPPVDDLFASSH